VLLRLYQLIDDNEAERLFPLAFDATGESDSGPNGLVRINVLVRRQAGE